MDLLPEETVVAVVVVVVRGITRVGVGDVTGLGLAGKVRGDTDRQCSIAVAHPRSVQRWTAPRWVTYVSPAWARLSPTCSVDDFANSGFKAALAKLISFRKGVTIPCDENGHVHLDDADGKGTHLCSHHPGASQRCRSCLLRGKGLDKVCKAVQNE